MSIKVMNMVFDRYPNGGGEMLLALALADHAHDDGTHIYPGVEYLMQKTRQSERSVRYQLRDMIAAGWLIPTNDGKGGAGNHRAFRISPLWLAGAEFSELKEKGANSAPLKKGANFAEKGAKRDEKGCKTRPPLVNISKPSVNRPAAHKGSRLPDAWVLPKAWGEWALSEFPHWDADRVRTIARLFRNYWVAKSGKDASKRDWFATWENWCIKENEENPPKNTGAEQADGKWWKTVPGIEAKGRELGLVPTEEEKQIFAYYRDRVFRAAGDGPWMDLLPRNVREAGLKPVDKLTDRLKSPPTPPRQGSRATDGF